MARKACTGLTKSLLAVPLALALAAALAACASASGPAATARGSAAASGGGGANGSTGNGAAPAGSGTTTGNAGGGTSRAGSSGAGAAANVPVAARKLICPPVSFGGSSLRPPLGQAIPAGFHAVAVVQCIPAAAIDPAGRQGTDVRKEVAIAGFGPLLTALREPSDLRVDVLRECLLPFTIMARLALVGSDGAVIYPRIPVNVCGAPIPQVGARLAALHWIQLGTTFEPQLLLPPDPAIHVGSPSLH